MNLDPEVIQIARKARKWAEARAIRRRDTHPSILSCYCAIASAKLSVMLTEAGIRNKLGLAECAIGGHVFVLVGNWIVDITATQFADFDDDVYVVNNHNPNKRWYHVIKSTYDSPVDLRSSQLVKGWPRRQIISKREILSQ